MFLNTPSLLILLWLPTSTKVKQKLQSTAGDWSTIYLRSIYNHSSELFRSWNKIYVWYINEKGIKIIYNKKLLQALQNYLTFHVLYLLTSLSFDSVHTANVWKKSLFNPSQAEGLISKNAGIGFCWFLSKIKYKTSCFLLRKCPNWHTKFHLQFHFFRGGIGKWNIK